MSSPTTTSSSPTPTNYLTNIGLGYTLAIALGFLLLLSAFLLASYLCLRARHNNNNNNNVSNNNNNNNNPSEGIILPRIFFVAEDENEERGGDEESQAGLGLDQAVINTYPMFQFSKPGPGGFGGAGNYNNNSDNTCSICLCEYKDSEKLRMMPECRHYFHMFCLDPWLKLNGSCPVCRNSPLPTPLSTPLSELVPLSQYAADRRRRR